MEDQTYHVSTILILVEYRFGDVWLSENRLASNVQIAKLSKAVDVESGLKINGLFPQPKVFVITCE